MDHDEYTTAMYMCYRLVGMLGVMPLEEMARAQQHAEAVGPILDPTLFRAKAGAMSEDATVVRALLSAQRALRPLIERGDALVGQQ